MELKDNIENNFRISESQKRALTKLGLITIKDLLYFFPTRYTDISDIRHINTLQDGENVTILGEISNLKTKKGFKSKIPMGSATISDITGKINIIWFHQPYLAKMLNEGALVKVTGKVSENSTYGLTLTNPEISKEDILPIDLSDSLFTNNTNTEQYGYPVYPESKGVTSKWIYHTICKILKSDCVQNIEEYIPNEILEKYNLPKLKTALIWIHMPQKKDHADSARKRFAYEEIFFIQLARLQERKSYEELFSYKLKIPETDIKDFISRFKFTPTKSQMNAIDSILADFQKDVAMSRLVEGDVGSGKTFVAATVAYAVIKNRPVGQNFGNIQVGCRKFPSKVASATNDWTNISKNQLLKWIKNGEIPIVIGTHALISKSVEFEDLGLVIIDEQHRFGTNQRMKLAKKEGHAPHYLSMTATPIPRTLALTIYGDLDLSIIDEMPAGRKKVITEIVPPNKRDGAYEAIRAELSAGRQAYVICPRINEPDPDAERSLQMKNVTSEAKRLQKDVFPKYRIGIMHSKMTKQKKEEVMEEFANHEIDILVSTSVIEVGVNVPNATSIIIEGAERFGLAQLHQLRGRVIRSNHQSYCYLFAEAKTEKTMDRLQALTKAANGFELAELDLSLRGSGLLTGDKQWGVSDLGMEAIKNIKLVEAARNTAKEIIEKDAKLTTLPKLALVLKEKNLKEMHFE